MKRILLASFAFPLLVILLGSVNTAAQETFKSPSGLNVTLPAGWTYELDGEVMHVNSPDETVAMFFYDLDGDDVNAALDGAVEIIEETVTDVDLNDPTDTTINGLAAILMDGTGMLDDLDVNLGLALVANGDRVLFVYAMASSADYGKHRASVNKIMRSIKR